MRYAAFADKLRLPARIAHINAHSAGGQRVADPSNLCVRKLQHRRRALRFVRHTQPAISELISLARGHACGIEKAHLLGLGIGDRRPPVDGIDIEIADPLARSGFGARHIAARVLHPALIISRPLLKRANVTRNEQRACIRERRAGRIVERNPALHVDFARRLVEQRDIIRLPSHARRQIAQRERPRPRTCRIERYGQRRSGAQIGRNRIIDDAVRAIFAQRLDTTTDLKDNTAINRENLGAFAGLRACCGIDRGDRHHLPDRLPQKSVGRKQIIIEILLDDPEIGSVQRYGFRANLRRDIGKLDRRPAIGQRGLADVLNQREVIVIDRH